MVEHISRELPSSQALAPCNSDGDYNADDENPTDGMIGNFMAL